MGGMKKSHGFPRLVRLLVAALCLSSVPAIGQVILDTSGFSGLIVNPASSGSITGFDISADANLLVVATMGENYTVSSVTYHGAAQSFSSFGSFAEPAGLNKVTFWTLEDPVDTSGTDVTLTLSGSTFSGMRFAAWSLENADPASLQVLWGSDTANLSVGFTDLAAGSLIFDGATQNSAGTPAATGPAREQLYSAADFSGSGFLSVADDVSGDVSIGAGTAATRSVYAAVAVAPIPEPTTWVLLVLGLAGLALYVRSRRRSA